MATRPAVTRAPSVTRDQNQDQNHKRTRSQLTIPTFNVDYDRSPLKHAREALRRANARFSQSPGPLGEHGDDGHGLEVKSNMELVSSIAGHATVSKSLEDTTTEGKDEAERDIGVEDAKSVVSSTRTSDENESQPPSALRELPVNPFDFSADASNDHPKYPKRARSPSFDDISPPSPSASDSNTGGRTLNGSSIPPPSLGSVDTKISNDGSAEPMLVPASSDSTSTATSTSNLKRARLEAQGTLDTFFNRPSSPSSSFSSQSNEQTNQVPPKATPARRIFSVATSSSSLLGSVSTPLQKNKSTLEDQAVMFPKTPTIKELRAIPSLDLRTVTPSPRKHALQLGLGTPGAKSPSKTRAASAGAAFALSRKEITKEGESVFTPGLIGKKTSALREGAEPEEQQYKQTANPETSTAPPASLHLSQEQSETRSMDFDTDTGLADDEGEETPTTTHIPPSITISTSTTTITYSPSSAFKGASQRPPAPSTHKDDTTAAPAPSTPQHKILPSRPFPSGRLPSAKSNLSKLLSLSPLTPLSVLDRPILGSDEFDYEEEELAVHEDNVRDVGRDAAKLAMQEEGEIEAVPALPASSVPRASDDAASFPSPATCKNSTKGKHKGKKLSSTSRAAIGAAGIKKRKSLVSATSVTPRMRLTRASVLRQKAIQAQMRPPKGGKSRPSLFSTKNKSVAEGLDGTNGQKGREDTKEHKRQNGGKSDDGPKRVAEPQRSPRKTFVLTVPSSLSPRKSSSTSSSANSSVTLKSAPLESSSVRPTTFSLYPPSVNDTATTEQAQRALNKLSSALDKLAMPPPVKPNTSVSNQLRRPASEQRARIRPASSLGFTREMSVPVTGTAGKERGRPRAASRAGSAEPASRTFFPPPPPPTFGSSLAKDKGKTKTLGNAPRTAPVAFGNVNGLARPPSSFRFGLGSGGGVFGRPIPRMRASQKTSLETVQGSPVKGGDQSQGFREDDEDEIVNEDGSVEREKDTDADASASSSNANGDTSLSSVESGDTRAGENSSANGSGKELKRISKLNASRRASMAFSTLAQSLGTTPDMFSPFAPTDSKVNNGIADEQSPAETSNDTTSRPVRAAAPRSFGFGFPGLGRTQSENAVSTNTRARSVTPVGASESDSEGTARSSNKKSGGSSMGRSKMPGSLDVLDQCTIFVDVRTDEGEDAGALFVDMLRGLGAKVLSRVGQTCTHIVYKNGLASTLTRYRLLDEPRPSVIGIGWVVECVEKRARVDESRFQVDVESLNVAGTLKRRRSFLPRQITSQHASGPMDAFLNGSGAEVLPSNHPVPKACVDSDLTSDDGDTSQERAVLSGSSLNSNIHPLERARRRSVMIPR